MKIHLAALASLFCFLPIAQADSFRALAAGTLNTQNYQSWVTFDFSPNTVDVYLDNPQSETEFTNQTISFSYQNSALASVTWTLDSADSISFFANAPGNFNPYWQAGVAYGTQLPLYVGELDLTSLKYVSAETTTTSVADPAAVAPEPATLALWALALPTLLLARFFRGFRSLVRAK